MWPGLVVAPGEGPEGQGRVCAFKIYLICSGGGTDRIMFGGEREASIKHVPPPNV